MERDPTERSVYRVIWRVIYAVFAAFSCYLTLMRFELPPPIVYGATATAAALGAWLGPAIAVMVSW